MKEEFLSPNGLLSLDKTIAKDIFSGITYTWEVLPKISEFIVTLGKKLPKDKFSQFNENIWVAKNAIISETAHLEGPLIIDENANIRHCAFIRGNVIIGKNATVGNSTELKNVILFDGVQVPHYNYVGDSILGYKAHLGAGAITSNVKSNKSLVTVNFNELKIKTNLKKFGAIIGDSCEIGCNSVLNPGTILGKNTTVYPLSPVRGYVTENSIYKSPFEIIFKN